MRSIAAGIVLLVMAVLTGCWGGGPVTGGDEVATETPGAGLEAGTAQTPIDPPPRWPEDSVPVLREPEHPDVQTGDDAADPVEGITKAYAMAYFPIADDDVGREESDGPTALFRASRPGFGLYTYVIGPSNDDPADASGFVGYQELLRVIETYVLGPRNGGAASDTQAHVFLVPVDPRLRGLALPDQADPQLSALMHEALANQLRSRGERELVQQMEQSTGPVLVTSLAPSMLPVGKDRAQLLVDLGAIGPAYMYSVVDAYDRPIPNDVAGQTESLAMLRERLLGLFPGPVLADGGTNGAPPAGRWVFLLGDGPIGALDGDAAETVPTPSTDTDGSR